jgi:hypothetical protein
MLDALTARSTGPRPVAASGPPSGVTVVDTSDTEASVAWEAVANSEAYRVYRAAQNGSFALLSGPSNMYHDETVGQHFKSYHNKVSKSGLKVCYVFVSRVSSSNPKGFCFLLPTSLSSSSAFRKRQIGPKIGT